MALKLPAESHDEALKYLVKDDAFLYIMIDASPTIAEIEDGQMRVLWTGTRIMAASLINNGLVHIVEKSQKCTKYGITEDGRHLHDALRNRIEFLEQCVEDLEDQVEMLRNHELLAHLEAERSRAHTVLPEDFRSADQHLAPAERNILALLAANIGQTMTKEYIHEVALNPDTDLKIVDVQVCKLRKKMKRHLSQFEIKTVWGNGYYLEAVNDDDDTSELCDA